MKTIEEAAKEFSNTKGNQSCKSAREVEYDTGRFVGFKAGVKFAQRWIPIEEELPPIGVEVVVKERFNEHEIYVFNLAKDRLIKCQDNCITHWRPIEFK